MASVPYGTPGGGTSKNQQQVKIASKNRGKSSNGFDPFWYGIGLTSPGLGAILGGQPDQQQSSPYNTDFNPSAHTVNSSVPQDRYDQVDKVVPYQPDPQAPSLTDFLQQALGMVGRGGIDTSVYDNQINQLQQQGQQASGALSKAYADLVARYAADLPSIQANYDQAAQTIQANAANARNDTNAGYGAAAASQNDMLKNLGIQDAQANIIEHGNSATNDQAHTLGNIAQGTQSNLDLNALQKQIAEQYNTQAGQAQGVAGATQQALLQQNLSKQLGALGLAKSQAVSQGISNNFSQAMQLGNALSNDYWNQQDRNSQNDLNSQKLLLQEQSAQQKSNRSGSIIDLLNQYIKSTGQQVDPKTYAALLNAFANAS